MCETKERSVQKMWHCNKQKRRHQRLWWWEAKDHKTEESWLSAAGVCRQHMIFITNTYYHNLNTALMNSKQLNARVGRISGAPVTVKRSGLIKCEVTILSLWRQNWPYLEKRVIGDKNNSCEVSCSYWFRHGLILVYSSSPLVLTLVLISCCVNLWF